MNLHRVVPLVGVFAVVGSCQGDQRTVTGVSRTAGPAAAITVESTTDISPTADTHIKVDAVNYSPDPELHLYTWPNFQIANAVLMKFDLASIPPGSSITSATLNLYLTSWDATADPTYTVTAHTIVNKNPTLSTATGFKYDGVNGWTPNACCQAPLAQSDIGPAVDTKSINKTAGFKQWDVTSIIQGWLSNPSTNFGLLVNSDPSKLADRWRFFSSKNHPTVGQRPYLTVVYTPPSTEWPNEPPGFTPYTERPFDTLTEGGWGVQTQPGGSPMLLVSDPTAPRSSPSVGQVTYPVTFSGGDAPAVTWLGGLLDRGYRQLYLSFWVKLSSNWQGHPASGVNKIGFVWMNDNNPVVYFSAQGVGDGPLRSEVRLSGTPDGELNLTQNLADPEFTRGQWHRWEVLLIANTGAQANGEAHWWIDGAKVGQYTSLRYDDSSANVWGGELSWFPIWGGVGESPAQEMYMWMDHYYVSGKQ